MGIDTAVPYTGNPVAQSRLLQRMRPREEDIRGPYFRDQTAIIHCTSFRRLKHKTQVIFAPENDHVCTRIEHVLHVATIAATICRGLARAGWPMDDELAYTAGLGHDLGHAPFGHSGERALARMLPGGFSHEAHSLRVVDHLSQGGEGLNLTWGVRDAIYCHNGERFEQALQPHPHTRDPAERQGDRQRIPSTWEGCAMRFADKIAYLGRDVEDALRAGLITRGDLPVDVHRELGQTNGMIINTLVLDLVQTSLRAGRMGFSDRYFELLSALRDFNYARIYRHERILRYERSCMRLIYRLFEHFIELARLGADQGEGQAERISCNRAFFAYLRRMHAFHAQTQATPERIVADYVAGMTDNYALRCNAQLTAPEPIAFDD